MPTTPPSRWMPILLIAGALAVWGLLLGLGAYLQVGADRPVHDIRRFWVVVGCTGAFLGFWAAALGVRALGQRRKQRAAPRGEDAGRELGRE